MGGDLENENKNPLTSRCVTDADNEAPAHFATKDEEIGLNGKTSRNARLCTSKKQTDSAFLD